MECEIIKFVWYQSTPIWVAIIAGIISLSGIIFTNNVNRKLAKQKNEIEIFKMQFAPLHEQRLIAIKDVYVSIAKLHDELVDLMSPIIYEDFSKEKIQQEIHKEILNFGTIWLTNKLFFSKKLADKIDNFFKTVFDCYSTYAGCGLATSLDSEYVYNMVTELKEKIPELSEIVKNIESDFREIIGSETTKE